MPCDISALTALPGVGRKTANVVRSTFFKKAAVVVDTHVIRIAGRLGWVATKNPDRVERELMALFPEASWQGIAPVLIRFGRDICQARSPKCPVCPILDACPFVGKTGGLS